MVLRTDEPERRFAPGRVLYTENDARTFTVVDARTHSGRLLVRFAELPDRTAAEKARGAVLVADVDPGERPEDEGEYYDRQLIGLRAVTEDGAPVGVVSAVLHLPAQDVLQITTASGVVRMVPFVAAFVPVVDLDAATLVVAPIAGLLDDPEDSDEDSAEGRDDDSCEPGADAAR